MKKKKKKIKIEKGNVFCEGDNCYCDMQETLNKIFPYYMPNCLTEDQYKSLKDNLIDQKLLSEDNINELLRVYKNIFRINRTYGIKVYNQLERVFKEYESARH